VCLGDEIINKRKDMIIISNVVTIGRGIRIPSAILAVFECLTLLVIKNDGFVTKTYAFHLIILQYFPIKCLKLLVENMTYSS
jgi:hypothetical protein